MKNLLVPRIRFFILSFGLLASSFTFAQDGALDDDALEDDSLIDTSTTSSEDIQTGWFKKFTSTSGGELTIETRAFEDDKQAHTYDQGAGLYSRLEHDIDFEPLTSSLRLVARVDSIDADRNLVYAEEAWIGFRWWRFYIKNGFQMFNWTATEAFHPADVLNSRNFDSNIENAEKFGEFTSTLEIEIPFGSITAYYMPYYQLPRFPGDRSRLKFTSGIAPGLTLNPPIIIDSNGERSGDSFGNQGAVRLRQTYGNLDITVHALDMMSRNYLFAAINPTTREVRLIYPRLRQYGGTMQLVIGSWVFKSEIGYRQYGQIDKDAAPGFVISEGNNFVLVKSPKDHTIAAGGIEYGWEWSNGLETTLILEGQRYFNLTLEQRAALDIFQADILFGTRFSFNDIQDTSFLISVIVDAERKDEYLFNFTYKQRITEHWSISLGARRVIAKPKKTIPIGLENLNDSNQYYINLSRYF